MDHRITRGFRWQQPVLISCLTLVKYIRFPPTIPGILLLGLQSRKCSGSSTTHQGSLPSRGVTRIHSLQAGPVECLIKKRIQFDSKPPSIVLFIIMTSLNDRLARHTNAVNLARRYSVQNENDLLQESYFEEEEKPMSVRVFDHTYCQELSHHLLHPKSLPEECKKFTDVVNYLKRHDTDTTHGTQILS